MSAAIELQQITYSGQPGPHLLITAGVHGDEYEPMLAVQQLIQQLASVNLQGRVTLIPVVNQAAFECAARTADDGLDLARVCPGRSDGTVTERTAVALSEQIRAADYYIDLHTGGRLFDILPMVGYTLHTNPAVLEKQRAMARAFNLPIVWGTQGRLDGRSLSVARDAEVPALYGEYGGGGGNPQAVGDYVEGSLNVAAHLGIIQRATPVDRVKYVVEDDRDRAGHLQIQHPASVSGFFHPCVQLGQVVHEGEPLGHITDLLGKEQTPVPAGEDGLVLFLRDVPSVVSGDTLGGLLPICEPGEVRYER